MTVKLSTLLFSTPFFQVIFRCKESFANQVKEFVLSGKKEALVDITPNPRKSCKDLPCNPKSSLKVRLIRLTIPNGKTQILMTSLLDKNQLSIQEASVLCSKRWGVETFYDRFRNIIGVEQFSGTTEQFIQQEFNCALYMTNLQTILTHEAQMEAESRDEHNTYEYKINRALSFSFMREKLIQLYTIEKDDEQILTELKKLFTLHLIPVRPNRSNDRDVGKYRQRLKPKQFKNRRTIV